MLPHSQPFASFAADFQVALKEGARPPEAAPLLHLMLVPEFKATHMRPRFVPTTERGMIRAFPHFHGYGSGLFRERVGGHVAFDHDLDGRLISRISVRDDWLVHSVVAHPFRIHHGRLALPEFDELLADHMQHIARLLADFGVDGEVHVAADLHRLWGTSGMKWGFPRAPEHRGDEFAINASELAVHASSEVSRQVRAASRYGF